MALGVATRAEETCVRVTGVLDLVAADHLYQRLVDAVDGLGESGVLVVDLTEVRAMDSGASAELVWAHHRARRKGARMLVVPSAEAAAALAAAPWIGCPPTSRR